jgi:hypothetical protein
VSDDDVERVEVAEGRFVGVRTAKGSDCGLKAPSVKVAPGSLVLPDADDAEPFVGGAGNVQDEAVGDCFAECRRNVLVLMPARGDVLDDGIALGGGSVDDLCVHRHRWKVRARALVRL